MILTAPPPFHSFTFLILSPSPNISRSPPTPWETLLTYLSLVLTPLPSRPLIRLTLLFPITVPFSSPSLFQPYLNQFELPSPPVVSAPLISLPSQMIFYLLHFIPLVLVPSNLTYCSLTRPFPLFLTNMLHWKMSLALLDPKNPSSPLKYFLKKPKGPSLKQYIDVPELLNHMPISNINHVFLQNS